MIYHHPTQKAPLKILQINVGRASTAHEIALALAYTSDIDIILIQEPYIFKDLCRQITKKHPSYECFSPTDSWIINGRPRVLTYVRKRIGVRTSQIRPLTIDREEISDLLFLQVLSPSGKSILIVNIYNAPAGSVRAGEAAKALTTLPQTWFPQATILAGDLNLLHNRWQPSLHGNSTAFAEPFIDWLDNLGLVLISDLDHPTHDRGNMLDLSFASSPLAFAGAKASIASHLDATSDHRPLITTVPWDQRYTETAQKLRFDTLDHTCFLSLLTSDLASIKSSATTEEDIDALAGNLTSAIQGAYRGSAKRTMAQGIGQPWWNDECKKASHSYRLGLCSKTDFRRITRRSQRHFWRDKLSMVSQMKDVFDMSKWHKSTGSFRSPPLKDPLRPDSDPAIAVHEKRDVLARNLLQNLAEAGDIPLDSPAVPSTSLYFPDLSIKQVEESVLQAGNTAPGADEIPTCILKVAWPLIKDKILMLYQGCLKIGYHPKCFRHAILAMIQKPNKTDWTSPRSYRPIALLSVLGKGLERLVARNMAWIAIHYKVLARQQFGALPLRSAIDLTTCLTHDVEQALNQGMTASILTLDIKGAFDAVLPGRLVRRLREQGWPINLILWIASFATGRSVQIRLDGETGPPMDITCGLPQGSPISGILFMLYIAPLFRLGNPRTRFGYADDAANLAISPHITTNCQILSDSLQEALDWGAAEGITFAPDKYELLHFSRRKADQDPNQTPSVTAGSLTISEHTKRPYLRWLGVLFDKNLSFKWHASETASKALTVANALRSLGNTVRGVKPHLLQQAVTACVLHKAYYGAETWWPGRMRPGTPQTSNRVEGHLKKLTKAVLAGARAVLPVFRTTPVSVLHRESGFYPPEIELDQITLLAAVRLRRLDPYHPLRKRAEQIARSGRPTSRFARRVLALPNSEQINPLQYAPWYYHETREDAQTRIGAPMGRTKEQAAADFLDFQHTIPGSDIIVFSDGSKHTNGHAGGGYVGFQAHHQFLRSSLSLGPGKEVFDAEAEAALAGAQAALAFPTARFATNLWICLDNQEVATRLLSPSTGSSQKVFESFCTLAAAWPLRERLPHTKSGSIRIRWVPGHAKIPENEAADLAAKEGAAVEGATYSSSPHNSSFASLKRYAKAHASNTAQALWQSAAPQMYQNLGIATSPKHPAELQLTRVDLGHIIAARTGHGDFADYHERFNHDDAHLNCRCGARKAPLHFFFCHIAKRRAPRPPGPPYEVISFLLGTAKGAQRLAIWLAETRFFEDICPRNPSLST